MYKQFKKGDVVWRIAGWDSKATVSVKKLTIQSWGKRQGTATSVDNGEFVRSQFYVNQADDLYLASEVEDINAFALEVAKNYKAKNIQWCANAAHHHYVGAGSNAFDSYFISIKKQCEEVIIEEPTVLFK